MPAAADDEDPADDGVISTTDAAQLLADTSVKIQRRREQQHADRVDQAAQAKQAKDRAGTRARRGR